MLHVCLAGQGRKPPCQACHGLQVVAAVHTSHSGMQPVAHYRLVFMCVLLLLLLRMACQVLSWQPLPDGGVAVTTDLGNTYTADKMVLSCGAWMTKLVPELEVNAHRGTGLSPEGLMKVA